jgi:hypothetical protein
MAGGLIGQGGTVNGVIAITEPALTCTVPTVARTTDSEICIPIHFEPASMGWANCRLHTCVAVCSINLRLLVSIRS